MRDAREKQNITIKQLAEKIKLGEEQLIALENGEEELLPERVYIRAMVRRVAEHLNIDSTLLIERLSSQNNSIPSISQIASKRFHLLLALRSKLFIRGLLLLIGIMFISMIVKSFSQKSDENSQSLNSSAPTLQYLIAKRFL